MKVKFLVAASLYAVPASAFQDTETLDRCMPLSVMMGVHKPEPIIPKRSPKAPILPKAQIETTGPAVLIPNCKDEDTKRRKKRDYPLA